MRKAEEIRAAHQRKRFMRPDASRYMRPQAYRAPWQAAAEVSESDASIAAERRELLAAKALAADLKFYLALRRLVRKYRPDQPRDELGQWVDDSSGDRSQNDDQSEADDAATDFSAVGRLPRIPNKRPSRSSERTAIA